LSGDAERSFAFGGLFSKQVAPGGLSEGDSAGAGDFKRLFGPGMRFYLRHTFFFALPLLVALNRQSSCGTVWEYP